MSNTLTTAMYKIVAQALPILRETALGPRVVSLDYQNLTARKGQTIQAEIWPEKTPYDITPSATPLTPDDTTPTNVSVTLDNWKGANFHATDKEIMEVATEAQMLPRNIEQCIRALGNEVSSSVFLNYKKSYGVVGTAGDTPFSNATDRTAAKDASQVAAKLTQQLAPKTGDRFGLLDENAYAEATVLPQFSHAEKRGNNNVVEDASLGIQYGLNWLHETNLPTHTAGTAKDATVTCTDANAVGDTVVTLAVGAGTATLVEGDIITFANHTQTYVVASAATLTTGGVAVTLGNTGGLVAAVDGSGTPVAVTVTDDHAVNLCLHRDAIVLVSRLLERDTGNPTAVINDPVTGLTLRLERVRQNKQTMWEFDILWGTETFRDQFMVRLLG